MEYSVKTCILVLAAIGVVVWDSNLLKDVLTRGFTFPVFCTFAQMMVSHLIMEIVGEFKLASETKDLSISMQLKHILPIAFAQTLTITLVNCATMEMYPSFLAMIACSELIVNLVLRSLFQTQQFTLWARVGAVPIIAGITMICIGQGEYFHFWGVGFLVAGAICACVRHYLERRLGEMPIKNNPLVEHPMAILFYTAPFNVMISAAFVLIFETTYISEFIFPASLLLRTDFNFRILFLSSAAVGGARPLFTYLAASYMTPRRWALWTNVLCAPLITLVCLKNFFIELFVWDYVGFAFAATGSWMFLMRGMLEEKPLSVYAEVEGKQGHVDDEEAVGMVLGEDTLDDEIEDHIDFGP